MNIIKSIKNLSKKEKALWIGSLLVITLSFVFLQDIDYLTVITSLIGATALIFLSKGDAIGQVMIVIFSLMYSIISFIFGYYGELITYAFMTLPTAVIALISWIRNPYTEREVRVSKMTGAKWLFLVLSSIVVTAIIGYSLYLLNTANLVFSILSISTSYFASMLMVFRSPYYAIGYSFNDVVLIILWTLATVEKLSYLPMVICFVVFLANDIYGYVNWQRISKRQSEQ